MALALTIGALVGGPGTASALRDAGPQASDEGTAAVAAHGHLPLATGPASVTATADARAGSGPSAPAPANVDPFLDAAASARVDAALELIGYPWRTRLPGWTIHFVPPRPGFAGMTFTARHVIEIYVGTDATPQELAEVTAHELGHAVDVTLLTSADRDAWRAARHLPPSGRWNPEPAEADFGSGAGDFAEAFAAWQVGKTSRSTLAPQPDARQLRLVARLARYY